MNKQVKITAPCSPAYDEDGYGWAQAQAALIRARRVDEIDWENVAEEVESVGKSERSGAESALRVLMMHILKWNHQPKRRGRSWALSIATQRLAYLDALADNPSLKAMRDDMRARAYRRARLEAAKEADLDPKGIPTEPLSWRAILEEPFDAPPE